MNSQKFSTITASRIQILDRLCQKISQHTSNNEKLLGSLLFQKTLIEKPILLNKNYKSLYKEIEAGTEYKSLISGSEDFISVEKSRSQICPLTQRVIEELWTSKCGHCYEKTSVMAFMRKGSKKCVVAGCDALLASVK
ncbi:hypothetical protein COBT_001908 [Conglomerata obtusa]